VAALIQVLPVLLRTIPDAFGVADRRRDVSTLTFIIVGTLIIVFLIAEPAWPGGGCGKPRSKSFRVWPFPY